MKKLLLSLALAATALVPAGAPAQFYPGGDRSWGPNGNGTLDHEDDLRWIFFHDAKVTADEAKGVYRATFSPLLKKENGASFSITGYMLPVESSTTSPHFVLTRRSAGCPFCPPNEPTEAIEVFSSKPVAYTQSPITIEGTLQLVQESDKGLFFKLNGAKKL
ncbi:hypothetical protein [Sphingomonas bacterium]|uniref:hypothetical protein n=1 Tax=Sphingomonas bacterium TaxID=1895847 RepID=UPI0015768BB4|nr:hypothetical protein [Sphingomonas bacterium]